MNENKRTIRPGIRRTFAEKTCPGAIVKIPVHPDFPEYCMGEIIGKPFIYNNGDIRHNVRIMTIEGKHTPFFHVLRILQSDIVALN